MRDKQRINKLFIISLILIFVNGFIFSPLSTLADKESSISNKENESGFLIHSEKVQGKMDLIAALNGKVDIKSGSIEGLTIISELNTPKGPIATQITSEGPVKVTHLKAETVGDSIPKIGGFCGIDLTSIFQNIDTDRALENLTLNQLTVILEKMGYDLIENLDNSKNNDLNFNEIFSTIGDLPLSDSLEIIVNLLKEKGYQPEIDLTDSISKSEMSNLLNLLGLDINLAELPSTVQPELLLPVLKALELEELVVSVCLTDVSMMVVKQNVENITIPNANIKTCYKDECDFSISDYDVNSTLNPLALNKLPRIDQSRDSINEIIEEQQMINDLKKELEKQLESLHELDIVLNEINKIYEEVLTQNYVKEINEKSKILEGLISTDQNVNESAMKEIKSLAQDINNDYSVLNKKYDVFVQKLNQASNQMNSINEQLKLTKKQVKELNKKPKYDLSNTLMSIIYEKYGDQEYEKKVVQLTEVMKQYNSYIEKLTQMKKDFKNLSNKEKSLLTNIQTITKRLNNLKELTNHTSIDIFDEIPLSQTLNNVINNSEERILQEENQSQKKEQNKTVKDKKEEDSKNECIDLLGLPLYCD